MRLKTKLWILTICSEGRKQGASASLISQSSSLLHSFVFNFVKTSFSHHSLVSDDLHSV
jgi:hypothetical protein